MEEEESILNEFLVECSENLEHLDQEFVALEEDPENASLLGSIFRAVHTIKGTCGFFGFPKLENVAHGAENILSLMRDREMAVTPEGITLLLEAIDSIKEILAHIESERKEPEKNYDAMRQRLDAFLENGTVSTASKPEEAEEAVSLEAPKVTKKQAKNSRKAAAVKPGKISPSHQEKAQEKEHAAPAKAEKTEAVKTSSDANPKPKTDNTLSENKKSALSESTIRVDVNLLDRLINFVGELVLARNQLLQQVRDRGQASSTKVNEGTLQQINLITTELQATVMKTRMQPIKNLWDKLPRVVRDLAHANGKSVDLVVEGAETELDKTLLEAIKDPMTHIIRNAVDHGIELPELRREQGKQEKGTLSLKASHECGRIIIQISDDGAGIDIARVKAKAVEKELMSVEMAEAISDRDALHLIFHPGLSTAQKVTNVSGRGVGMDVVKTNIEKIGGTVSLSSRAGEGTEMRIEIPLTLAIIPALMVTSGGGPFAIPQASLIELVLIDKESQQQVEVIRGAHFYRLRGVLLPLIYLNQELGLKAQVLPEDDLHQPGTNIVVLKVGEQVFGLVVDFVNDSEEIVVKPLTRQLRGLTYLAGATILGDGRVALILDVMGIADQGGVLDSGQHEDKFNAETESGGEAEEPREAMVLFSMGGGDRYAVSLSEITRLETFDPLKVEHSSGQEVIQYRGDLLPLVRLEGMMGAVTARKESGRIPVIVFTRNGRSVGMVVGRIIDIVEAVMHIHETPGRKTVIKGSIIIDGLSTDLLDVDRMIACVIPEWVEALAV